MPDAQPQPQPQPQPQHQEQPLPNNNIGNAIAGIRTLTGLPVDKLLTLFVCLGFGFLLYEDKRSQGERDASLMRTFEDSRENDRKFHSEQREKDRSFYSRERELDRTAIGALAMKIERVETTIWKLKQPGQEDDGNTAIAPMPKPKSTSN